MEPVLDIAGTILESGPDPQQYQRRNKHFADFENDTYNSERNQYANTDNIDTPTVHHSVDKTSLHLLPHFAHWQ